MTSSFSTSFLPIFKSKRKDLFKNSLDPFPNIEGRDKFKAVFNGFSVEVFDEVDIKELFNSGCYGRGSYSKSTPACLRNTKEEVEQPLIGNEPETLTLYHEEAFFLMHFLNVLEIKDLKAKVLTSEELFTIFNALNSSFTRRVVAYLYLKAKNWIIRDGMKFGSDFIIYKKSIRIYHGSFSVHVIYDLKRSQVDLQCQQRTTENTGKDLLYLTIHLPNEEITVGSLEKCKVSELIVKRFDLVSFTIT